jgi:pyruvate/2-oxoacid:ferredoxin oxidoreductase alpha subunit
VQTYYPITPAADESEYLEAHQIMKTSSGEDEAIVVIQTEDEIAAINSASGAASNRRIKKASFFARNYFGCEKTKW